MTKHKATNTNYCNNLDDLRFKVLIYLLSVAFMTYFFEILFKIKFVIPNSIDIGAVGRWIYIGAADLHRGGGAVDLDRGGGAVERWIYIGAVDLHSGGGAVGRWIYIGAVGGGFTKCLLIYGM